MFCDPMLFNVCKALLSLSWICRFPTLHIVGWWWRKTFHGFLMRTRIRFPTDARPGKPGLYRHVARVQGRSKWTTVTWPHLWCHGFPSRKIRNCQWKTNKPEVQRLHDPWSPTMLGIFPRRFSAIQQHPQAKLGTSGEAKHGGGSGVEWTFGGASKWTGSGCLGRRMIWKSWKSI